MKATFIVTIDPVKDLSLLNILIHSLNLQTASDFDVVFNNQTLMNEEAIFSRLIVKPLFPYRMHSLDKRYFFGRYPVWDLYEVHNTLLKQDLLNEYFISLHMEEFLDVDYVEKVLNVLAGNRFDILFGNLSRTQMDSRTIEPVLRAETPEEFDNYLLRNGLKDSPHWASRKEWLVPASSNVSMKHDSGEMFYFNFKESLEPTRNGFTRIETYVEDVYFMSKQFAKRHNWFLDGHHLYFEDIQICEQKGVCELARELEAITKFPIYFNQSKIYHLPHNKYYFQLEDDEFATAMLDYESDDPVLNTLKKAITLYRSGELDLRGALMYTRKNEDGAGSQNLNYKYHMLHLRT